MNTAVSPPGDSYEGAKRGAAKRLAFGAVLWCVLLLWMHGHGATARGVPTVLRDIYYGLEAVFLPAVLFIQQAIGRRSLSGSLTQGGKASSEAPCPTTIATNALSSFVYPLVFGDVLLRFAATFTTLPTTVRMLPLAFGALAMVGSLQIQIGRLPLALRTALLMAMPALLVIR